jgi:hypothetical protein
VLDDLGQVAGIEVAAAGLAAEAVLALVDDLPVDALADDLAAQEGPPVRHP